MLEGKIINLELISEDDAEFVVNLRNHPDLVEFISATGTDVAAQKNWIRNYKVREQAGKEFYFIVTNKRGESCGCVRISDLDQVNNCCTFGSFILHPDRPDKSSYDVFELIKKFVAGYLNLGVVKLKVFKSHAKAIYIYLKVGFVITHESDNEYFFELKAE